MAAIPTRDVLDNVLSTDAEVAKDRVRAISNSPKTSLNKIGSSGLMSIDELEANSVPLSSKNKVGFNQSSKLMSMDEFFASSVPLTSDVPSQEQASNVEPQIPSAQPTNIDPNADTNKQPKETGFWEDVGDTFVAFGEGGSQLTNRLVAVGGVATNNEQVVVDSSKQAKEIEKNSEAERLVQFKDSLSKIKRVDDKDMSLIDEVFYYTGEVAKIISENVSGTTQFIAEQLPNAGVVLGAGWAGAKAGAAVGTIVNPGFGTAVGGTIGFIAGMFGGNALIETGAKAQEKAADGKFTDAERAESIKEGVIKGAVITGVDVAFLGGSRVIMGTASKAIEQTTISTLKRFNIDAQAATKNIENAVKEAADAAKTSKLSRTETNIKVSEAAQTAARNAGLFNPSVIRAVKESQQRAYDASNKLYKRIGRNTSPLVLETIGEGVGEYLGELAATGKADVLDAVIESLAGAGQSVTELRTIASQSTEEGKVTRTTGPLMQQQDMKVQARKRAQAQKQGEIESKQRQDVGLLIQSAIDVEKTLQSADGVKFLIGLYKNSVISGKDGKVEDTDENKNVRNLFEQAASRAGVLSEFEDNLNDPQYLEAGQQLISDSPVFAKEFYGALEAYVKQQPTPQDAKFKFKSPVVTQRQANNQMDEDLMAQEQSGQLFTSSPTDTNVTEQGTAATSDKNQQSSSSGTELYSKTKEGRVKAVFFKDLKQVYYSRFAWNTGYGGNTLTPRQFQALELHEIGAHYAVEEMLGNEGYQSLLSDLSNMRGSDKLVDEAYQSVPEDTPAELVNHEALGYLVENYENMGIVRRFLQMLSDWYQSKFKNKSLTPSQIQGITRKAFRKYKRDITKSFLMQNISATPGAGKVRVDFQNALNSNAEAMKFLEFMQQFKDNAALSGSLALSAQRDIFRDQNQQIHDLDFRVVSKEDLQSIMGAVAENYPNSAVSVEFSSKRTGSDVVSVTLDKDNPDSLTVDFFTKLGGEPYEKSEFISHNYTNSNGENRSINLLSGDKIFEAKLKMGRVKDVNDAIASQSFDTSFSKEQTQQATPPQESAQPRQVMTLQDIGLAQQEQEQKQSISPEVEKQIEQLRNTGYQEATVNKDFPSNSFDETLNNARNGSQESLNAASNFLEASKNLATAKKKVDDLKPKSLNFLKATQEVDEATKLQQTALEDVKKAEQERSVPKVAKAKSELIDASSKLNDAKRKLEAAKRDLPVYEEANRELDKASSEYSLAAANLDGKESDVSMRGRQLGEVGEKANEVVSQKDVKEWQEKQLERDKKEREETRSNIKQLLESPNLWDSFEALKLWEKINSNVRKAINRLNAGLIELRQLRELQSEIKNRPSDKGSNKQLEQIKEIIKERKKIITQLSKSYDSARLKVLADMAAYLVKYPDTPHRKILDDHIEKVKAKIKARSGSNSIYRQRYPESYFEALQIHAPFKHTIYLIIRDIYESNEQDVALAVEERLKNFGDWVSAASESAKQLEEFNYKEFTPSQINHLSSVMLSKFATIPNLLATLKSYEGSFSAREQAEARREEEEAKRLSLSRIDIASPKSAEGKELQKRMNAIVETLRDPKIEVDAEITRLIEILSRIQSGKATAAEKAEFGHLGGFAYTDPSTAQTATTTEYQDAEQIKKEILNENQELAKNSESYAKLLDSYISDEDIESRWNARREVVFHKLQNEYRRAIDAGLNPQEASEAFAQAVQRLSMVYAYKPNFGIEQSLRNRYDPVLSQMFGDMEAKMFPKEKGTTEDLEESVKNDILESMQEQPEQKPSTIIANLISDIKSAKISPADAVKSVRDALRNKEINFSELRAAISKAGLQLPAYIAPVTSHISLRYTMEGYVKLNGGGKMYEDAWLADHHSLKVIGAFSDIQAFEDGQEIDPGQALELSKEEEIAYQEWLDDKSDAIEKMSGDIKEDFDANEDVLKKYSFYRYTLSSLSEVSTTEEINAWHADLEYALRKYPHLRNRIISNDPTSDALVTGVDAQAHKEWMIAKLASIKNQPARKANEMLVDLLDKSLITEEEFDVIKDKLAVASANEYQAIINNAILLSKNHSRKDRNRKVKPTAKSDVDTSLLSSIKRIDEALAKSAEEIQYESNWWSSVGIDSLVNSKNVNDEGEFVSEDSRLYPDEYYDSEIHNDDISNIDPDFDVRLRQGAYSGVFTAAQTQIAVNNLLEGWAAAPKVHVLSRPSLIPEPARTRILGKIDGTVGAKGAFDPFDGSVYIFSDYVTSEADLEFTLYHEVSGHLGLNGLLGNKLNPFLQTAYRTNAAIRTKADALAQSEGMHILEAVEEVLADANVHAENPSLIKRYVGAIIRALREIGFNKVADWMSFVTTAEVQYVLYAARQYAKKGDMSALNGAPDAVRLSTSSLPYEMFTTKNGKLSGYARYNPLVDEWYVFTSLTDDIRSGTPLIQSLSDINDVRQLLLRHGKIEERKRSSFYKDNKVPASIVSIADINNASGMRRAWNWVYQKAVNEYLPVFNKMDQLEKMGRLSEALDLRTDLTLYERKTGALLERFNKRYVKDIQRLYAEAIKKGATEEFINLAVVAQHAQERNESILYQQLKSFYLKYDFIQTASGVMESNGDPKTINSDFSKTDYENIRKAFNSLRSKDKKELQTEMLNETGSGMGAKTRTKPDGTTIPGYSDVLKELAQSKFSEEIRELGAILDRLGDARVDYLVKTGLVSFADGAKMKSYRHYRNLSGINQDSDENPYEDKMLERTGRKFNAGKSREKRALGRGDIATDVIARTLAAYEAAIIRGQKNEVAQKVLAVFEHNYDPQFIVINEIAKKQKRGPDGVVRLVIDEEDINNDDVMVARVGGIPVKMKFKQTGYGSVGQALHGMVFPPESAALSYYVGRTNRFIGQLLTTWNPLWVPVNAVRDIQTLYSNAVTDGRIGTRAAKQMMKMVAPAMRTAVYINIEESKPTTALGKLARSSLMFVIGKPRMDLYKSFHEARLNGGLTYFIDRKGVDEQLISLNRLINGFRSDVGKLEASKDWTLSKFESLGKALEFFTIPFELGPRLAAYHVARDSTYMRNAMSKSDAAVFSGDITVNFNMRGSATWLRQWFLFFNPAVQGTDKMRRLAISDPSRFASVSASWIALGAMMNIIGRSLSGDDDNGENKIDGIPVYKRATSMVFAADVVGASMPIAYGWNFFYSVGTFAMDSIIADVPVSTSAKRIAATGFEAFSPVGVGIADASSPLVGTAKTFTPQIGMPLVEYALNENRFGSPIRMDDDFAPDDRPDTRRAFRSVHPISKYAMTKLHNLTGGNAYSQDGIDINPALIDQMIAGYLPGVIDTSYKELGRYMRQSSGLDVDEGKPNPIFARFTAYRPEMMDAAIFRRAEPKLKSIENQMTKLPENHPDVIALKKKYPNVGYALEDLKVIKSLVRKLSSDVNSYEAEMEYKKAAGTLTKEDEDRYVKVLNRLRQSQIFLYKQGAKSLIKNGFRDLVVSGD